MKTAAYILITLLTAGQSSAQIKLVRTGSVTSDGIHDIFFLDDSTGWAFTYGTGIILKSTDSGKNWTILSRIDSAYYEQIQFLSEDIGYICGGNNAVFKSTDGGIVWQRLPVPGPVIRSDLTLVYAMKFQSETTGLIGRSHYRYIRKEGGMSIDWRTGSHDILRTADGGKSWSPAASPPREMLFDFHFTDSSTGFAGGENSIYKTVTGGERWSPVFIDSSRVAGNIRSVWFTSPQAGFAVSWGGILIRTSDGGISWNMMKISDALLRSVCFISDSVGVATGNAGETPLYVTSDSGKSWKKHKNGYPDLHRARRSESFLWLCGKDGTILKGSPEKPGLDIDEPER